MCNAVLLQFIAGLLQLQLLHTIQYSSHLQQYSNTETQTRLHSSGALASPLVLVQTIVHCLSHVRACAERNPLKIRSVSPKTTKDFFQPLWSVEKSSTLKRKVIQVFVSAVSQNNLHEWK